ncbi:MAG TPA: GGDEF domain-containing protein [Actinoplanes sp.]|nr:GGDEF domain-containing protein [Actinoplanes sp.]
MTLPRAAGMRTDPLLVGLCLFAVLVPPLFGIFGVTTGPLVAQTAYWVALTACSVGWAVLARRLARRTAGDDPFARGARRIWWLTAAAGVLYALGDAWQVVQMIAGPSVHPIYVRSGLALCAPLAGMVLVVAGLLLYPGGNRAGLRMDVATVMAGAITAGVLLIEPPAGPPGPAWAALLAVAVLSQPGVFLVAILAVAKLVLGGRSPFRPSAAVVYGAAAILQAVLQAVPTESYGASRLGAWLNCGNVLSSVLMVVATRLQARGGPARTAAGGTRPYSYLPYASLAVSWATGVVVLAVSGLTWRSWLVIAGIIVTTALVAARQAAAFRRIGELLRERDQLAARLTEQAFHDALTGLANRALFLRDLGAALTRSEATVFLIDLDEFKPVNDRFGHATGDRLLIEVGRRLHRCVRPGDTVARLGGDEFAVLVDDLDPERRETMAAELRAALSGTVEIDGVRVPLRASVGMATGRPGRHGPDMLLHEADMAMYAVKYAGRAVRR